MQWIRNHLSFANAVSMIALFVALGGTTYAAVTQPKNSVGANQIRKNAVGASEIKRNGVRGAEVRANAVGASEIRSNAVGGADILDSGVGGADIADNAVGGSEIGDGQVGSSEVTNDSLTATDILGNSLEGEISADVIARVQPNGVLLPKEPADNPNFQEQSKDFTQDNIEKPAATTGIYCIKGLPKQPRSAMVASDNAGASAAAANAVVVSVAVERGNGLGGCATTPATQLRVVATNVDPAQANAANVDKGFILWLEY